MALPHTMRATAIPGLFSVSVNHTRPRRAHSDLDLLSGSGIQGVTTSFSAEQQITVLRESVTTVRRKFVAELDDVDESSIQSITVDDVLDYIERQRLTHMPHRGSHWDNVLKWTEFFALQVSGYAVVIEPFVPESKAAAKLIWTASQTLLNVRLSFPLITSADIVSWVPTMRKHSRQLSESFIALACRSRPFCETARFFLRTAKFERRSVRASTSSYS